MCAIVDANVANEVFGDARTPAEKGFFDWLSSSGGQLVVGSRCGRKWVRTRVSTIVRLIPLTSTQYFLFFL